MAHHVEGMPTKVRELEMTSGSQDVLYLSVSGVVAGMFVIDITADPMVKRQMQRLKEEQISVVVKSVDSCITLQRLTTLFGVPDSMLKILPSADNDLYEKETAPLRFMMVRSLERLVCCWKQEASNGQQRQAYYYK